jgi:hypothetical protein
VQRTIAGILGDTLIRTGDTAFTKGDWVVVSGEGDTVEVDFSVHSSQGTARLRFYLTIACAKSKPSDANPNPTGYAVSIDLSDITALEVDGDVLTDLANELGIAQAILESEINERLAGVRDGLNEIVRGLPLCPRIAFQKSSTGEVPPGSKVLNAVGYPPPDLVIDLVPGIADLGVIISGVKTTPSYCQ